MKTSILSAAIAAVVIGGMAPATQAANVRFDRNGAIGGSSVNTVFDQFDWNFGNILFENLFPTAGNPDASPTTVLGQAKLSAFQPDGDAPFAGTEFTYVFSAPSLATFGGLVGPSEIYSHSIDPLAGGGFFEIYFDDFGTSGTYAGGIASDDISGTGFSDGHLILAGRFAAGGGTLAVGTASVGGLDQTGVNGDVDGGVTTVRVTGSASYELFIDSFDTDFFIDDIDVADPVEIDFSFSTDTSSPFLNAEPSDTVVGVAPVYGNGINDSLCGAAASCDLHVEGDARLPLNAIGVPEPMTVALLGLGLVGIGASRRLSRKA